MTDWLQVSLRIVHILTGVFWAGTLFFLARFLIPALKASGPAGDAVMQDLLVSRKLAIAIPMTALLTVLSGATLYWRNISMSNGAWAHSRPGMVFGIGGACALVALIIGATIIGPNLEKVVKIQLNAKLNGGALTPEQTKVIAAARGKASAGTPVAAALVFVTVITMAIGRYM